jgi:ABC-2 type transport system ATP-binding protein
MIRVEGLGKSYWVHSRQQDIGSVLASLFRRREEEVVALRETSFAIGDGERVGFLGPNGAGKTTLMKLMAGLLHPTTGHVDIDGHVPWRRDRDFLRAITMVMGSKSQLIWDLPPADSFEMIRAVYRVDRKECRRTLSELSDLLNLAPVMHKPTRQLSLGERMRCEIAAALIHRPKTLFLDEPTIGLDAGMQAALRDFVAEYNRTHGATILLTSHYMQDVIAICPRVVVINHGRVVYDGELRGFVAAVKPEKVVSFRWEGPIPTEGVLAAWNPVRGADGRLEARVPSRRVAEVVGAVIESEHASDLMVEDPSLDEVLREVYVGKSPDIVS